MHRPLLITVNKAFESGSISKDNFLDELKRITAYLEESIKCLTPEAEGTKEAYQAKLAAKSLSGIKEIIFFSEFL